MVVEEALDTVFDRELIKIRMERQGGKTTEAQRIRRRLPREAAAVPLKTILVETAVCSLVTRLPQISSTLPSTTNH